MGKSFQAKICVSWVSNSVGVVAVLDLTGDVGEGGRSRAAASSWLSSSTAILGCSGGGPGLCSIAAFVGSLLSLLVLGFGLRVNGGGTVGATTTAGGERWLRIWVWIKLLGLGLFSGVELVANRLWA